jgi:hypothetical protein
MDLKSKLAAAMNRAKQSKGGPEEPKTKEIKQVDYKPSNVFTGPMSNMKAKRAIRKGETDTAYSVKDRKMSGNKVVKQYGKLGEVSNKPIMNKKVKTTEGYRMSEMRKRTLNGGE